MAPGGGLAGAARAEEEEHGSRVKALDLKPAKAAGHRLRTAIREPHGRIVGEKGVIYGVDISRKARSDEAQDG